MEEKFKKLQPLNRRGLPGIEKLMEAKMIDDFTYLKKECLVNRETFRSAIEGPHDFSPYAHKRVKDMDPLYFIHQFCPIGNENIVTQRHCVKEKWYRLSDNWDSNSKDFKWPKIQDKGKKKYADDFYIAGMRQVNPDEVEGPVQTCSEDAISDKDDDTEDALQKKLMDPYS